jgi:hypothetical membrane protein
MHDVSRRVAGTLFFIGGSQFAVGMMVAEAAYPGYSISRNAISDLGVGPTALIFNSSIILFGVMMLASAYFIQRAFSKPAVTSILILTAIGVTGVGIFPENVPLIHEIVSLTAFLSGGIFAIVAYRILKPPLSYFSVVMGLITLLALALFAARQFLGLGLGGMERMIAYPILLLAIGFGGYLIGSANPA